MNFYEVLFLIQLLIAVGITGLKILNLFSAGALYNLKASFLLFIGYVVTWFFALLVAFHNASTLIYITLWGFESVFLILNVVFLIIEVYLMLVYKATDSKPAYFSLKT